MHGKCGKKKETVQTKSTEATREQRQPEKYGQQGQSQVKPKPVVSPKEEMAKVAGTKCGEWTVGFMPLVHSNPEVVKMAGKSASVMGKEYYRKHSQLGNILNWINQVLCEGNHDGIQEEKQDMQEVPDVNKHASKTDLIRPSLGKKKRGKPSDSDDGITSPVIGNLAGGDSKGKVKIKETTGVDHGTEAKRSRKRRKSPLNLETNEVSDHESLESLVEQELLSELEQTDRTAARLSDSARLGDSRKTESSNVGESHVFESLAEIKSKGDDESALEHSMEHEKETQLDFQRQAISAGLQAAGYLNLEDMQAELLKQHSDGKTKPRIGSRRKGKRFKDHSQPPPVDSILNPSSKFYNEKFAAAYQSTRNSLQKASGKKQKLTEAQRLHSFLESLPNNPLVSKKVSALTIGEHSWYLEHRNKVLIGEDEKLFSILKAKFDAEQKQYKREINESLVRLWKSGRYNHMTDRQRAQIDEDDRRRRGRTKDFPRLFVIMDDVLNLDLSTHSSKAKTEDGIIGLHFQLELSQSGTVPKIRPLPSHTILPGNKRYLPAALHGSDLSSDTGFLDVYRKNVVSEIWDDTFASKALKSIEESNAKGIVAATQASMLCLLSSAMLNHPKPWTIPVVVNRKENSPRIYFGKPFPKLKEKLREKQRRLQKYAVLTQALGSVVTGKHDVTEDSSIFKGKVPFPAPRMMTLNLFLLEDGIPVVIRSHSICEISNESSNEPEQNHYPSSSKAILQVKTEYLPEPELEQDTDEELLQWWGKLQLNPSAHYVDIARVHVPLGRISQWRTISSEEIRKKCSDKFDSGSGYAFLHSIVKQLIGAKPGKYIICCRPERDDKRIFIAQEMDNNKHQQACHHEKTDRVVDLHHDYMYADETDLYQDPIVPVEWHPVTPTMQQIPYTYPPRPGGLRTRQTLENSKGVSRHENGSYWDIDQMQQPEIAPISDQEYMQSLMEGL